jgi:hypothetical protein
MFPPTFVFLYSSTCSHPGRRVLGLFRRSPGCLAGLAWLSAHCHTNKQQKPTASHIEISVLLRLLYKCFQVRFFFLTFNLHATLITPREKIYFQNILLICIPYLTIKYTTVIVIAELNTSRPKSAYRLICCKIHCLYKLEQLLNHTEITNKMQPCTRIYYSNVYQLLNMFRATHRSSSGAQKL